VLWILCAISSAGKFSCILCMTCSCCSKCSYARLCSSLQLHWKCLWPQCQGSLAEIEADGPDKFGNSKLFFYLLCLHDFSPCKLGWVGQLGWVDWAYLYIKKKSCCLSYEVGGSNFSSSSPFSPHSFHENILCLYIKNHGFCLYSFEEIAGFGFPIIWKIQIY